MLLLLLVVVGGWFGFFGGGRKERSEIYVGTTVGIVLLTVVLLMEAEHDLDGMDSAIVSGGRTWRFVLEKG